LGDDVGLSAAEAAAIRAAGFQHERLVRRYGTGPCGDGQAHGDDLLIWQTMSVFDKLIPDF
jgi:hypothetical protein